MKKYKDTHINILTGASI